MKILITGSRGMVGSNLIEHKGISASKVLAPSRTELDLTDRASVEDYLSSNKPDFVIHAAGRVGGIQANISNPVDFLVDNLDIGRNLIGSCFKVGIKRLINLSSSCVYPRDIDEPLREQMILKGELEPTNEGYALAKIAAQRLCEYVMREDSSFNYKTMIPCNLYGRYDHFDATKSHLIPAVILKLHEAKVSGFEFVEIWGNGEARREFMYAGDLADCIFKGIERFDSLPNVMNVGLGIDYTINEYYAAAAEVIGYNGKYTHNLSKPVGMKRKLVSTSLANKWGWKAQTNLHDGIAKAYEYYLSII